MVRIEVLMVSLTLLFIPPLLPADFGRDPLQRSLGHMDHFLEPLPLFFLASNGPSLPVPIEKFCS